MWSSQISNSPLDTDWRLVILYTGVQWISINQTNQSTNVPKSYPCHSAEDQSRSACVPETSGRSIIRLNRNKWSRRSRRWIQSEITIMLISRFVLWNGMTSFSLKICSEWNVCCRSRNTMSLYIVWMPTYSITKDKREIERSNWTNICFLSSTMNKSGKWKTFVH